MPANSAEKRKAVRMTNKIWAMRRARWKAWKEEQALSRKEDPGVPISDADWRKLLDEDRSGE